MNKYLRKYIDIFSKNNRCYVFFLGMVLFSSVVYAQINAHKEYIERFKDVAISNQQKYGIPASIILAQGVLESDAGRSKLAKEANNHFGIKCGGEWDGKTVKHDAETGKECFRKYNSVEDSYLDHSLFLKRKRYEPLFKFKVSDYKNWAKGLRQCGYATDPEYPNKLITLIERYELHKLAEKSNKKELEQKIVPKEDADKNTIKETVMVHAVHRKGKLMFIRAHEGDTYETIALEFGMKKKKLMSFNDIKEEQRLFLGDIVYLQEKDSKYSGKDQWYVVSGKETLYSISQKLGIRLKKLCKMNKKSENSMINIGDSLKIK